MFPKPPSDNNFINCLQDDEPTVGSVAMLSCIHLAMATDKRLRRSY